MIALCTCSELDTLCIVALISSSRIIPEVLNSFEIWGLCRPLKQWKLAVMFLELFGDVCLVTWCIIMLDVFIRVWINCNQGSDELGQQWCSDTPCSSVPLQWVSGVLKYVSKNILHTITLPPSVCCVHIKCNGFMDFGCLIQFRCSHDCWRCTFLVLCWQYRQPGRSQLCYKSWRPSAVSGVCSKTTFYTRSEFEIPLPPLWSCTYAVSIYRIGHL